MGLKCAGICTIMIIDTSCTIIALSSCLPLDSSKGQRAELTSIESLGMLKCHPGRVDKPPTAEWAPTLTGEGTG